jgi:para-nitrobenzyl esterase
MGAPPFGMFQIPQNFRDGTVLPLESLLQRFGDTALYNDVPMILGSNRDEYKVFTAQDPRFVQRRFGFLPRIIDQAAYDRFNGYFSDQWKALAVDEPARVLSNSQGPTIYAYRFDWDEAPSNWMVDFPKLLGAGHGLEVSFVFGDFEGGISVPYLLNDENEPGRTALSTAMMNYWGEFAHSGAPGRGRDNQQPLWQPWGSGGQTFLVLDTPQDGNIHMSNERITAATLKQRLAADTLFEEPEQRCALYAGLFLLSYQSADFWDEDEYQQLADGACAAYPPHDFADQFR